MSKIELAIVKPSWYALALIIGHSGRFQELSFSYLLADLHT